MGSISVSRRDVPLSTFHGMVTVAEEMRTFFRLVERVSRTTATVLVHGEPGTGKELVARAIHALGPHASRRFCAVNCAASTPDLLASELFGHLRGAAGGRRGLLSRADGGTLFLDEVGEINGEVQARLLRLLQERTYVPLGGIDPVTVDVRVLSATSRPLREQVETGRFREDLLYRIRVVQLFVPPLRERTGDVEALAWNFVDGFNEHGLRLVQAFEQRAMAALSAYRWPGNLRELRNAIEHTFSVGEGPVITLDELPPELRGESPTARDQLPDQAGLERERIVDALRQTRGRKAAAADLLGMSRSTLWRKMREYAL